MKRISNRPLAALVAFALVVGLVPFNALAEEDAIPPAEEAIVEQVAEDAKPAIEQPEKKDEAKAEAEPAAADATEAAPEADPADDSDDASLPEEGEKTAPAKEATPAEEATPEAAPAEEEPSETEPAAKPAPASKSAAPKLTPQATTIDPASITVTPPTAGSTQVDAQSVVSLPANAHYSLRDAYWVKGDSSSVIVDRYTDIEAGQQYALTIILRAENDYEFGGGYSVTGATAQDDGHMRVNNDPIYEYVEGEFVQVSSSEGWANVLVTPQAETVGLHVWSLGHGTINVNGSYYGTEHQGTWSEGAEVTVEALPADGYRFGRWWIKNASGTGRVVSDSTVTLVAGTDLEANVTFGLETASVTVTSPAAGSTAATAPQVSVPSGAGYGLDTNSEFHNGPSARWVKSSNLYRMEPLEASTTFEAGETYYAYVRLSEGADSFAAMAGGSTFNTDLQVSGGLKTAQGNFAATDPSDATYMGIEAIIAVTIPKTVTHTVAFDTHGAGTIVSQEVEDGGYATRPATPLKEGLHLLGWYEKPGAELTRDEVYSGGFKFADTPITGDKTLHAVWYASFFGATYDLSAVTPKYAETGGKVTFTATYQQKSDPSRVWWSYSIVQGSQVTVTAIPEKGARFVGWAPATLDANENMPNTPPSLDEIVSTENPYSFTFEGKTALAALFEKEVPSYDLTVSFESFATGVQDYSAYVESLTVNGEDWMPASGTASTTKAIPAGAKVTAVVKATDQGIISSLGRSTSITDFVGAFSDDYGEATFTFTMPAENVSVDVFVSEAVTITLDANGGTKTADWVDFLRIPKTQASRPTDYPVDAALKDPYSQNIMVEPAADYTFAGIEFTQNATGVTVTGKPGETLEGVNISKGGTIKFLWEKVPALTLHWSSPDGVDLVDPVVIDKVSDKTVAEALGTKGWDMTTAVFSKDGYQWTGYQVPKPMTAYSDIAEMETAQVEGSTPVGEGLDIYYVMFKKIDAVEMTVNEAPTCGTEVALVGDEQTNAPSVTLASGGHYGSVFVQPAMWGTWKTDHVESFEGTLKGGESYPLLALLEAEFGYCFADDATATVNGATDAQTLTSGDELLIVLGVSAKVTAEHVPGAAVNENVKEPTCTTDGSHDEVVNCSGCKEELSRKTVTDKALGHDWGAWKTVTEPTEQADGLREHVCGRCDEVEEEVIPKLVVEYTVASGDGSTYTLGSGEALTFTFKRSVNDDTCFSHFTGVKVDGKALTAKDHTAKAGSTVVTLNASYLETLKAGNHTLTALFDDGNGEATASFAVAEKPAPEPTPDKKDEAKTTPARKSLPQTGDTFALVVFTSITVALVGVALTLAGRRIREQ